MSLTEIWERLTAQWQESWAELSTLENQWTEEDPRLVLSVVAGILTAVLLCVMTHRKITLRNKQRQLAIEAGRVIDAKRVSIYRDIDTDENTGAREVTYHGTYEYTLDGKTRRYRVNSKSGLPSICLHLYYTDPPRKVFSDFDSPQLGYNVSLLLGIVACLLTMYLTGYIL